MILFGAVVLVLLLKGNEAESYVQPHASQSARHSRLNTGELARLINIINQNGQQDKSIGFDFAKKLANNDMSQIDKNNHDTIAPDSERGSKEYPVKIHIIENPHSLEEYWGNLKTRQLSSASSDEGSSDYFAIRKLLRRNDVFQLPETSGKIKDETPKITLRNSDDADGLYKRNFRENDKIIHFIPSRENRRKKIEEMIHDDDKHNDYYDKTQLNIFNTDIMETNAKETKENIWDWITRLPSAKKENSVDNYKKNENYNERNNRKDNYYDKKFNARYSTKDNYYNDDHQYNDNNNNDYNRKDYNNNDNNYKKKTHYFDDYNKKDDHNDDYQNKDVYDKKIDDHNEYYNEKDNHKSGYKEKDDYNDDIKKIIENNVNLKQINNKYNDYPKKKKTYNDASTKEKVKDYYDEQWKSKESSAKDRKKVKSKGNWDQPKKTKTENWDNWKIQQEDTYKKMDWDKPTKSSKAVTTYAKAHRYKEIRNNEFPKKEFVPKNTEYYSKPKKHGNYEGDSALKPFGRTSIPFAGKKGIYEDQ